MNDRRDRIQRGASATTRARALGSSMVGFAAITFTLATSCAPRPAMCARACDAPFACASGECVRPETVPAIEARVRLGDYQARRLVIAPADVARLAPGDAHAHGHGEVERTAVLGRDRDARAMLLLRFAVDLPPGTSIVEAHVLLERTTPSDDDPAPIVVHAARIEDPWDARSVTWGRAPRIQDTRLPSTTIDVPRREVRLDVLPLVRGWREHAPEDQGIVVLADTATPTGTAFALADGAGSSDHAAPPLPAHAPGTAPLFVATEGAEAPVDAPATRGPRLELYVKP